LGEPRREGQRDAFRRPRDLFWTPPQTMILADENIPHVAELFGRLGPVIVAKGREIDPRHPHLGKVEVLAIRSVTPVTAALIDRAPRLGIVATATIGTDHIDTDHIEKANARRDVPVRVVSAPGSNADSVADYVFHAIAHITCGWQEALGGRSIGIIGFGNV